MDTRKFMELSPENLAKEQYLTLRRAVAERLKEIAKNINEEDYDSVEKHLSPSPAGDGYGTDTHYIDFSDLFDGEDLQDAIDRLRRLQEIAKQGR